MLVKAKEYLRRYVVGQGVCLLGLSGGPDSIALFRLLIELGIPFHVLHIDHNCRQESTEEALQLKTMVEGLGIPFHLVRLDKVSIDQANLEDFLRRARYHAFASVYDKIGADVLLLAHHRDDQGETVLKRVLEGSSLSNLKGIQRESSVLHMNVLRPLLDHGKEEMLSYIESSGLSYFLDKTNLDPRFLRARMRVKIIPELEKTFGKGIRNNLALLGERCGELEKYLTRKTAHHIDRLLQGAYGDFLPAPLPLERVELEFIIQKIGAGYPGGIAREEVDLVCQWVQQNKEGKKIERKGWTLYKDRNGLFFLRHNVFVPIQGFISDGWRAYWVTPVEKQVIHENWTLGVAALKERLPNGASLKKWYTKHRVPAFMRGWPAVIYDNNCIVGEVLTGFDWGSTYPYEGLTEIKKKIIV